MPARRGASRLLLKLSYKMLATAANQRRSLANDAATAELARRRGPADDALASDARRRAEPHRALTVEEATASEPSSGIATTGCSARLFTSHVSRSRAAGSRADSLCLAATIQNLRNLSRPVAGGTVSSRSRSPACWQQHRPAILFADFAAAGASAAFCWQRRSCGNQTTIFLPVSVYAVIAASLPSWSGCCPGHALRGDPLRMSAGSG